MTPRICTFVPTIVDQQARAKGWFGYASSACWSSGKTRPRPLQTIDASRLTGLTASIQDQIPGNRQELCLGCPRLVVLLLAY
jgi:hypothetical protein